MFFIAGASFAGAAPKLEKLTRSSPGSSSKSARHRLAMRRSPRPCRQRERRGYPAGYWASSLSPWSQSLVLSPLGWPDHDLRSLSFLPLGCHCVEWASLLSALENSKGLEILRLRSTSDDSAVGQVGCGQLEESGRHNCLCHPPRTPAGGTLRPHPNRHRGAMTSDVHFQAITTASYIREPQPP